MKLLPLPADAVLRAQAALASENLERCTDMLNMPELGEVVPAAVRDPLRKRLRAQKDQLEELAGRVGPDSATEDRWRELQFLTKEAEAQLAESLGFLEGALIRRSGLDGGICRIADWLLDELSASTGIGWVRLTILAAEESYAQRAGIIHLRFPEFTVWALPLAAHEFGHVVAQELREMRADGSFDYPVTSEITSAGSGAAHQRELFADIFATYALGPAYPCTAILLRFSPTRGASPDADDQHPNDGKRVSAMLKTLRWLSRRADPVTRPYDGIAAALETTWTTALRATGADDLDEEALDKVAYWVEVVYLPLLNKELEDARYGGWGAALELARRLDQRHDGAMGVPRIADVLNAAWRARLARPQDDNTVERLGAAALELCRRGNGAADQRGRT